MWAHVSEHASCFRLWAETPGWLFFGLWWSKSWKMKNTSWECKQETALGFQCVLMNFDLGLSVVPPRMEKLLAAKNCYLSWSTRVEGLFITTKVLDSHLRHKKLSSRIFYESNTKRVFFWLYSTLKKLQTDWTLIPPIIPPFEVKHYRLNQPIPEF